MSLTLSSCHSHLMKLWVFMLDYWKNEILAVSLAWKTKTASFFWRDHVLFSITSIIRNDLCTLFGPFFQSLLDLSSSSNMLNRKHKTSLGVPSSLLKLPHYRFEISVDVGTYSAFLASLMQLDKFLFEIRLEVLFCYQLLHLLLEIVLEDIDFFLSLQIIWFVFTWCL